MVVAQEQIIEIIRQNGPLLPVRLAKAIGSNILIASAHLSNLVDEKKVRISNTKVGGSPLYYLEGQQGKLLNFASNLNEKDQKTLETLKNKRVLRDDKQDQLTRLSLRTIKDFSVPLQVIKDNEKILFWKWYLISNKEAEEYIKRELEPKPIAKPKPVEKLEPVIGDIEKKKIEEERKRTEQRKLEIDKRQSEEKKSIEQERRKIEEERKKLQREREQLHKQLELERQTMLKEMESKRQEIVKPEKPVKKEEDDEFLKMIMGYFKDKKIELVEHKIIRKHADIEMVLRVPSVVGNLDYYCKAKNKKNVNDADLSSAVVQGQLKKLPVLFLTTGELTKKAKELLNTELNKGLLVKKI